MNIVIISPINDLNISENINDQFMVLAWLLQEEPSYLKYFKKLKKKHPNVFVTLDNGLNENRLVKGQELIDLALDINADEIITPDVYMDGPNTITETSIFLDNHLDVLKNLNVMSVPQGHDRASFLSCFENFLEDKRINTLGIGYRNLYKALQPEMEKMSNEEWTNFGIPNVKKLRSIIKESTFYYTVSRLYFIRKYVSFIQLREHNKNIHLLGLWNPYELSLYKTIFSEDELKYIRSCDSAAPNQAAQVGVKFDSSYGVLDKPIAYLDFKSKMTDDQIKMSLENIEQMRSWI